MSRASSGQALLIAVLVLFAVATLGALFAGIIGAQISQVARQSDMVALRNIAEAGLRLANEQLTYSPAGADWRPSAGPYRCGEGHVTVAVTYGPSPDQLQSRFVRIVATAVFPDNPFLRHTILALKPVLLTDYARFITDRFETDRTAALGVTGLEANGTSRPDYVSYIEGPIRSNTDVTWYGQSQVSLHTTFDTTVDWRSLGILRDDRIEVAGFMRPATNPAITDGINLSIDGVSRVANLFAPATEEERFDYAYGFPRWWEGGIVPNSRTLLTALPEVLTMTGEIISGALAVPRVRPPEIDAIHPDKDTNRYLSLTRDSGFWVQDAGGFFYNTGEFGWGWANYGGIYIDNVDDIQYDHNLEKLRLNWTRSVGAHDPVGDKRDATAGAPRAGPADWWDKTDRYYAPPGVEIILHGDAACPWVEIIRHDLKGEAGAYYYWREQDGEPIYVAEPGPDPAGVLRSDPYTPVANMCSPAAVSTPVGIYDGNRAIFPFPPNGVIYAEGNVRIRGIMPPVRDSQGRSGLGIPVDEVPEGYLGWWNPMTGRSRRFDLQVVSGGTIYIEGDLMSPSTAQLTGLPPVDPAIPLTMTYDQLYGSRIALLARDYVCVNTTALNPRPVDMLRPVEDPVGAGTYAFYNDAQLAYPPTFAAYPRHWLCKGPVLAASAWDEVSWLAASPSAADVDLHFGYNNVRLRNPDLRAGLASTTELCAILGHAGWYVRDAGENGEGDSGEPLDPRASSRVGLAVNTLPRMWDGPSSFYNFVVGAPSTAYESNVWIHDTAPGVLQFLPHATQSMTLNLDEMTGRDLFSFTAEVLPVVQTLPSGEKSWVIPPQDLGYVLGPLAVAPRNRDATNSETLAPLPVDIDALIYAQNGSWFVIPGAWFNEDAAAGLDPSMEYPGYHEPLNIRLSVYGAITENMPADLGSVADWTSKWGGPVGEGASGFLAYRYDPLLRWPRRETEARVGYLRFPNFPLTSDLVIWGERVSGPAGT
jgi:hypothetical protein